MLFFLLDRTALRGFFFDAVASVVVPRYRVRRWRKRQEEEEELWW